MNMIKLCIQFKCMRFVNRWILQHLFSFRLLIFWEPIKLLILSSFMRLEYIYSWDSTAKWREVENRITWSCHNPTNNPKQLKTTFVGVVLLSVRKPTTTTMRVSLHFESLSGNLESWFLVYNIITTHLQGASKKTGIMEFCIFCII